MFSRFFNNDDIALIKLSKPVQFSDKISTICLPSFSSKTSDLIGQNANTIGWYALKIKKFSLGVLNESFFFVFSFLKRGSVDGSKSVRGKPAKLQQTQLQVIKGDRCNRVFLYDETKMYCTLDVNNINKSSNVCFGDSGGPLMYMLNGRWHLYGITSMVILNGTVFNRYLVF